MKVFTCLLFIRIIIFAQTLSLQEGNKPTDTQRTVNLEIETVLEFDNKDNAGDVKFLDNIQNFITKVKTAIGNNKNLRRNFRGPKIESFTDFFLEVLSILNSYDDDTLKEFFAILDEEIRKYHYRGCKFYELTENYEIRKWLGAKLDMIKGQSVFHIKKYINILSDLISAENYEKNVKDLVKYVNTLYKQDAKGKFIKVLYDLYMYGQTKSKHSLNLVNIVKDGVRSIIFDHFTDLNPNARRKLKTKIESFWKQNKQATRSKNHDSNNFEIEVFKGETTKNVVAMPSVYKKEDYKKNERRIEIKKSDYKKKDIKRDSVKEQKKPKVNKATKIDTVDYSITTDGTSTKSKKDDSSYQSTTTVHNDRMARTFSSDEGDEFPGESFEGNSIEFFQEQQKQANTQRYVTLYLEAITDDPNQSKTPSTTSNLDPKSIIHRSAQLLTYKPRFQTLWMEESTGGIPKYVLKKYTTEASHKQKTPREPRGRREPKEQRNLQKHDRNYESRHETKHVSEHESKHDTKHKPIHPKKNKYKHTKNTSTYQPRKKHHKYKLLERIEDKKHTIRQSKHRKPLISKLLPKHKKIEPYVEDSKVQANTTIEMYEYKKMLEPAKIQKKTETTTTELLTTKPITTMKQMKETYLSPVIKRYATPPEYLPPRKKPSKSFHLKAKTSNKSTHHLKINAKPFRAKSTPSTELTRPTRPAKKKVAPVDQFMKRFEMFRGKQHRDIRKSALPSMYNDKLSIEQFEKERKDKRFYRKSFNGNLTKTTESLDVVDRLKNLEKALSEMQNRMKEYNITQLEREITQKYDLKTINKDLTNTQVRKNITLAPNDQNVKRKSYKLQKGEVKDVQYKKLNESQFPNAIVKPVEKTNADVANISTITYWTEMKTLNNDSKQTEPANEELKEFDEKSELKAKVVEVDQKANDEIHANKILNKHEKEDLWKATFNSEMKASTKSIPILIVSAFESKSTIKPTTVNRIEKTVTPPIKTVSASTKISTTPNIVKKNVNNTNIDIKGRAHLVNSFIKPSNVTKQNVLRETSRVFKTTKLTTVSATKVAIVATPAAPASKSSLPTTKWKLKELAFPPEFLNGSDIFENTNDLLLPDPFADIELGMDFKKTL